MNDAKPDLNLPFCGYPKNEPSEVERLRDINKDLLEALTAIRARISGEWDNPALLKFGPLSDMTTDIQIIARTAIAKAEGKFKNVLDSLEGVEYIENMNSTHRPKIECNNPIGCGNTLYEASYNSDQQPVWRCTNCGQETRRISRNRRTNRLRAIELKIKIREEWASTDVALITLIDAGVPSGCLLVHGSAFNYHMEQLSKDKLNNRDIRYHGSHARQDLERAKQFVQEKQLEKAKM